MTDRNVTPVPKPTSIDPSQPLDPTVLAHRSAHRNHVALLRVQLEVPIFVVVMDVDGDIWSRCCKVRKDAHELFDAACVDFTPEPEPTS
jgi:hypothetical protein